MTKLKLARLLRRLTQREVAKEIGVSHAMVSLWENGYYIQEHQLEQLAKLYDVPVKELRGEITLEKGDSDNVSA